MVVIYRQKDTRFNNDPVRIENVKTVQTRKNKKTGAFYAYVTANGKYGPEHRHLYLDMLDVAIIDDKTAGVK